MNVDPPLSTRYIRRVGDLETKLNAAKTKLNAAKAVLADREKELLTLKGPCSTHFCRLHYAHSGPCDIKKEH